MDIYQEVASEEVRRLALPHAVGVYEGALIVEEDGGLTLALQGFEGDRVV